MMALVVFLLLLLVMPLQAVHKPLVPQPQHILYGKGRLALKGITISFWSSPAPEDRFAANELASALAEMIAEPVPVVSSRTPAGGIVFYRTGSMDALPGPDDRPGPESRESYTLHISDKRAEVRARSSAGLYYATQTIRQLQFPVFHRGVSPLDAQGRGKVVAIDVPVANAYAVGDDPQLETMPTPGAATSM